MTPISDSAWHPSVELAVRPQPMPVEAAPASKTAGDDEGFQLFGNDGFTFLDFIDIINPLQHIPVVSTLYRQITGDEIDPGSRVFGDMIFFGPVGLVASIGDVLLRDATGKDMGEHVMAFFNEGGETRPPEVAEAAGTVVADVKAESAYVVADKAEPAPLDPVTAWAMKEVAYRQAVATKIQSSTETRPIAHEQASAPMPAVAAAYAQSRQAVIASGLAQPATATRMPARLTMDSINAKVAQSIARHNRQSAAMLAAASYGRTEQKKRAETDETPMPTPPGAVAPLGGWFTEAMLKAHEKYQAGAANANDRSTTTLDVTH